jgi:hypothetical protein
MAATVTAAASYTTPRGTTPRATREPHGTTIGLYALLRG